MQMSKQNLNLLSLGNAATQQNVRNWAHTNINKYFMIYQYLYQYFILYIPYLTYHFNDSKIKNERKFMNEGSDK